MYRNVKKRNTFLINRFHFFKFFPFKILYFVFINNIQTGALMTKLFINEKIIDVFTLSILEGNVLVDNNGIIIGVWDYFEGDEIIDSKGKYLCPGFIDGHIHVESSMLLTYQFTKVSLPHGTIAIVADPHEISNVSGLEELAFMLSSSEN